MRTICDEGRNKKWTEYTGPCFCHTYLGTGLRFYFSENSKIRSSRASRGKVVLAEEISFEEGAFQQDESYTNHGVVGEKRSQSRMSKIVDDKSDCCILFILDCINKKSSTKTYQSPVFIGVNGIQGSGKSTLVSANGHQSAI